MTSKVAAVAIGGASGALLRFYLQNWSMGRWGAHFPYGTLLVNLTGALCIGFFMTVFLTHVHIAPAWRLFIVTGVLGGYTTFSALVWEVFALAKAGHYAQSFTYGAASMLGGLLCLIVGVSLARFM